MSFGGSSGGSGSISSASDVALSNPATGNALQYDSTTLKWKNAAFSKADVGLGNVNNTADADKPASTAVVAALNQKANLAQSMPIIFATNATSIPSRATSIPSGYTGPVVFDTAAFPTSTGPTDMQVGDRWRRRGT